MSRDRARTQSGDTGLSECTCGRTFVGLTMRYSVRFGSTQNVRFVPRLSQSAMKLWVLRPIHTSARPICGRPRWAPRKPDRGHLDDCGCSRGLSDQRSIGGAACGRSEYQGCCPNLVPCTSSELHTSFRVSFLVELCMFMDMKIRRAALEKLPMLVDCDALSPQRNVLTGYAIDFGAPGETSRSPLARCRKSGRLPPDAVRLHVVGLKARKKLLVRGWLDSCGAELSEGAQPRGGMLSSYSPPRKRTLATNARPS